MQVLVKKGVLSAEEARLITNNASPAEQRDRLAALLRDKGVISASEFGAVRTVAPNENVALKTTNADYRATAPNAAPAPQPSPPIVIAAVAPVRLLGIDASKREGLIPDIKLATGARLKLYGFFKTTLLNGVPVVAPQRPVRGQGGFIQLGFPLSRIFNADPKGRNAGWTAYLYYGDDQAMARDARRFGARGDRSDLFSGNIQY